MSAGSLWAGKFLGGAALVIGAFLCCYVPLTLLGGGLAREVFGIWLLALLGLMGLAHALATMYRSGSWLFALDLCLGAVWVTLFGAQVGHLVIAGVGPLLFDLFGSLPAAFARW